MKRSIEVCLTPSLLELFDFTTKIVVVVDIFRATTTIITALAQGAEKIRAVATVGEALQWRQQGYLAAGERGGQKVEGFDLGNSPYDCIDRDIRRQKIAITTTNGTLAIQATRGAKAQAIGAFLNISSLVSYLRSVENDILVLCAGWKGQINLEDTMFAGALIAELANDALADSDSARIASELYQKRHTDMLAFLKNSEHARRLIRIGYERDLEFCLRKDAYSVNGIIKDGVIESLQYPGR